MDRRQFLHIGGVALAQVGAAAVLSACSATNSGGADAGSGFIAVSTRGLVKHNSFLDEAQAFAAGNNGGSPGIAWDGDIGTPVTAAAAGTVAFAGQAPVNIGGTLGFVVLDHGFGYRTLYAVLDRMPADVRRGARVQRGQIIGRIAMTPVYQRGRGFNGSTSHLHVGAYVPDFLAGGAGVVTYPVNDGFGRLLGDPELFGLAAHWDGDDTADAEFRTGVATFAETLLARVDQVLADVYVDRMADEVGAGRPEQAVNSLAKVFHDPAAKLTTVQRALAANLINEAREIRPQFTLPWMNPARPDLYGRTLVARA